MLRVHCPFGILLGSTGSGQKYLPKWDSNWGICSPGYLTFYVKLLLFAQAKAFAYMTVQEMAKSVEQKQLVRCVPCISIKALEAFGQPREAGWLVWKFWIFCWNHLKGHRPLVWDLFVGGIFLDALKLKSAIISKKRDANHPRQFQHIIPKHPESPRIGNS